VPKYSPRAAKALAFLKRPYNDVDIFVEDTGNHNMWLFLLRKILPPRVRLTSVIQLGGRDKVVEACRLDQKDTSRRKLYIIDGDFDFLLHRKKPRLRFLYRLRAYCIENLLITEKAVVQIGLRCKPNSDEAQCSAKFDFRAWHSELVQKLLPLFVTYAVAKKLAPNLQTVSYGINQLYVQTRNGPDVCPKKVWRRVRRVASSVKMQVGLTSLSRERRGVSQRLKNLTDREAISAKDYIIPLLWARLRAVFKFRDGIEQLKVQLAREWEPNEAGFSRCVRQL
jgi:hypothetical protein